MTIDRSTSIARLVALCVVSFAVGVTAQETEGDAPNVDWAQYADVETVVAVTEDEDGSPRETTIWLAVVDGRAYIRTGGTSWGENVRRNPAITLRIEETDHPVEVSFIEDDAVRERVTTTFREKYGWSDAVIGLIRGSRPLIMQVASRT